MARLVVALVCLLLLPQLLVGQGADTTKGRGAEAEVQVRFDSTLAGLRTPAALAAPWLGAPRVPPGLRAAAWDSATAVARDSVRRELSRGQRLLLLYGEPVIPSVAAEEVPEAKRVLGISDQYANLGIDGEVRLEIRTDRVRNERCSAALFLDPNSGCRGGFKPPRLENHINLRSSGLLGRRVHLNVDYDNDRDFNANNDIQVYYEGLEDEIVRRIEVGTVTFQPARSRFITAAIPSNNFGVNARFEVGQVQIQALAATQKGSQVAERTYTVGQTTSQAQDRQVRDLDFESGRFFWVVDPTILPGYPALDILDLSRAAPPPSERPVEVRVYRFRPDLTQSGANSNVTGITALARTTDPNQSYGPVRWELLVQGTDYYLDPSALWFGLASKLDQNDYLAVSYVTADGRTVGSMPVEDRGPGSTDSLRLIVQPRTGPEAVTFRHEMRQIYRVAGSDLDAASLQVGLSVNRSERPQNGTPTYLSLLGLSIPTDPNLFDIENRLFPRPSRDPEAVQVVRESFVVFPHLTPFADATKLTPSERADSMYRTPLYSLLQQTGAKFNVRLRYNSTGAGDRSTLTLGALQLREGSEQLIVRGRRLERGVDYTITYDVGQVTFLNPDALFGSQATQVTARFEEQGVFAVAPTSILGLSTTYSLGDRGEINLIGMYQREQSAFNRPQLGLEASANLVAGANTELRFKPQGITRLLNRLTSTPTTAPSAFDVNGEFAFTKPDPNRSGQAYLEEFEGDAGLPVSLRESSWEFGSRPQSGDGLADLGFGGGFDPEDAVAMTWQNLVPTADGTAAFELRTQDIDTLIKVTGSSEQRETVLFMTLHADTAGGVVRNDGSSDSRWTLPRRDFRPRWRTMVIPLSSTGLDLTRNEFLEFWVFQPPSRTADSAGVRLALDIGTVDEDAIALAPTTLNLNNNDSTFTGRQYVGLGRLDTERRSIGTFNAETDDIGILGDLPDGVVDGQTGETLEPIPLCQSQLSSTVAIFPWGDLSSRCTRGNGVLDSEDLNGDNGLNSGGSTDNVFRYVVSLQPGSKYFVRTGTTADWQLYRIPIRQPDATIGTPNLRLVQHLRLLVAAPPDPGTPDITANFALARLRFVGSPWTRRSDRPIAGFSGSTSNPDGEVVVSVISTENQTDLGYEPPPGVVEGLARRNDASSGVQVNEKSLRVIGRQLSVGDRAEGYLRFAAGPQNVLGYRTLRVWARGSGAGWEEGELEAFVKLGSDDRNFYLYHTTVHSTTWTPELEIDLETWRRLRAELEQRWLLGQPPSGADTCGTLDPTAYVACEGPYLVHLGSPGINPPNLAAVQEMSAGISRARGAGIAPEAELWVDDIRLASPVSEVGTAVSLDARLAASDVGTFNVSYVRQDGQFRQINADPTYRTEGTLQMATSWRLDRFLPRSLGLVIPVNAAYARALVDPQLLTGTDLRGGALPGLRRPSSRSSTYSLSVRRAQKGSNVFTRGLLDPLSLTASLTQGRSQTEYTEAQAKTSNLSLGYALQLTRRGFRLPFGGVIRGLPKWLRESEAGRGLASGTFSLTPSSLRASSVWSRDQGDYSSFTIPVFRPDDSAIPPTLSLTHLWRNSAGLSWQPLGMLNLSSDIVSTRDLRVYSDSSSLGRVAYAERRFFLGIPVGVERDRLITTSLSLTPKLTSWLRPRLVTGSSFVLSRTLTSRQPVRVDGDSGEFILPQTYNNARTRELGAALDLSTLLRQVSGDSSKVAVALGRIRPVDFSVRTSLTSTYDLAAFDPSLGYMLALGGLDRFLTQEGVSALGVSDGQTTALTSGADLPLGFAGTLSYALTTATRYQLVGGRTVPTSTRQHEWPAGSVRWTQSFRGGPLTLVATNLGFRHREGTTTQPGGEGGVANAITSSSLNPDLQISFRNGIALSVGYASLYQHTTTSGNTTLLDQDDVTGSFSYAFRLPPSFGRSRRRVRSSVTVVGSKSLTCLERSDGTPCTVIADTRRQELRAGLDTDVAKALSAGLQFGYSLNDARHLNRRTSQISLLASFQLSLDTGNY